LTSNYLNPFHGYRITRSPAVKIDQNIGSRARVAFTYSDNHTESPVQALGFGEGFPEPITANAGTFEASPTFRLNFDYNLRPTMLFHLGAGFHNAASDIGLTGANSIFENSNQPACRGPCLPSGLWTYHGPNEAGNPTRGSLNSRLTDALLPAGSCRRLSWCARQADCSRP